VSFFLLVLNQRFLSSKERQPTMAPLPLRVQLSALTLLTFLSWSIQVEAFTFQSARAVSSGTTIKSRLFAKKKKKSSKNQQQQSGFAWASSFKLKPFEAQATRELVMSALASFQGRTGQPLLDIGTSTDIPKWLWDAPLAILIVSETTGMSNVNAPTGIESSSEEEEDDKSEETTASHDENEVPETTETATPAKGGVVLVKYANKAALETVGLPPDEYERLLTGTDGTPPSGQTGKHVIAINLPTTMTGDKQFQTKYTKKIIKGDDKDDDITIVEAQRWAIERSSFLGGKFVSTTMGIAYTWNEWLIGDSVVASPGGVRREHSEVDPSSLQEQIEAQGAAIRELKQGEQGLGNQDPQVKSAVAELLRLKSLLEEQQSK
jgi:hypothetical protein